MMSPKLEAALNDQIRKEFTSSHLYLAMSAWLEANHLPGMARWMAVQSEEERQHGLKILKFLQDRGARVRLQAVEAPPDSWKSPLDVFRKTRQHEREVTESIHRLYELASRESDPAAQVMLQWFVTEQVEEEKTVEEILGLFERIEAREAPLLMLDHQLGGRGKG